MGWLSELSRSRCCWLRWNVWIMERYRHGAGVVTYLARYLRGGPLKNARLVAWDGVRVTFTCRARQQEGRSGREEAAPHRRRMMTSHGGARAGL